MYSLGIEVGEDYPYSESDLCIKAIKTDDIDQVKLCYTYLRNSLSLSEIRRFIQYAFLSRSYRSSTYLNTCDPEFIEFTGHPAVILQDDSISLFHAELTQEHTTEDKRAAMLHSDRFVYLIGCISLSENREDLSVLSQCAALEIFSISFLGAIVDCCSDSVLLAFIPHIRTSRFLAYLLRLLVARPFPPLSVVTNILMSPHYIMPERSAVLSLLAGVPNVEFIRAGVAHGFPVPRRISAFIYALIASPNREISEYIIGTLYGGQIGRPVYGVFSALSNLDLAEMFRAYISAVADTWCPSHSEYDTIARELARHNCYDRAIHFLTHEKLLDSTSFLSVVVERAIEYNRVDAIKLLHQLILTASCNGLYVSYNPNVNEARAYYRSIFQ